MASIEKIENEIKHGRRIVALWFVLTVAGVLISLFATPWLMPTSASPTMHRAILTVIIFSISAAPVAAGVYAVVIHALTAWRWKGDGTPPPAKTTRRSWKVEALWMGGSTILTMFLLIWGLGLLAADESAAGRSDNAITVDVTGQQWLWSFSYPGTHVKSNELYLPVNKEVHFSVTSEDVVHGFWIVQMGIKVNANPGVFTETSVYPDRIGTYDIRCTEICGLNHAFMVTRVHVVSDAQYNQWLASQPSRI